LGYTAASGVIDSEGAALFMVLYFWQMPHFFVISWVYREDYSKGGFRMLSLGDNEGNRTAWHIFIHTVLMILASGALFHYSSSGWIYVLGALGIGVASLVVALGFMNSRSIGKARAVFKLSLLYLPVLFLALILDRVLIG
jgi:protoheme IX farnesyltransferase